MAQYLLLMVDTMPSHDSIIVKSEFGQYSVLFSQSLLGALNEATQEIEPFILVDRKILDSRVELQDSIGERFYAIEAEESNKTIEQVSQIYQWLLDEGANKSSTLIAIGGGIVQDLATFVSATYYRGISWKYLPTTLLSMSDSCIGGKCALNQGGFKNQIGIIWPPKLVAVFPGFLETLAQREIVSGYGEILKLSLTGQGQFFRKFKEFVETKGLVREGLVELIQDSLKSKIPIIEVDEKEANLRRVLNYGHTFGHALEAATNNTVSHGEAIVLGMDLVNYLGTKLGITDRDFSIDFTNFALDHFNLGELKKTASLHARKMFELIMRDKKILGDRLHLAIAVAPGDIKIYPVKIDDSLWQIISDYFHAG